MKNPYFWSRLRQEEFYNRSILIICEDFKISTTKILDKKTVFQSPLIKRKDLAIYSVLSTTVITVLSQFPPSSSGCLSGFLVIIILYALNSLSSDEDSGKPIGSSHSI